MLAGINRKFCILRGTYGFTTACQLAHRKIIKVERKSSSQLLQGTLLKVHKLLFVNFGISKNLLKAFILSG